MTTSKSAILSFCALLLCTGSSAQGRRGPFSNVAAAFERQRDALGLRVTQPGNDQLVYVGEFVNAITGVRTIGRVTQQLPGMLRLEGFHPTRGEMVVNGRHSVGVITRDDEALVETFVGDTTEGMLMSTQDSAAVRFLGSRFGPDPKVARQERGPSFDIYDVTAPIPMGSTGSLRVKLYYFDSETQLLYKTRYTDQTTHPATAVEVRFSRWGRRDGSSYPGLIERFENGRLTFSFHVTAAGAGPKSH